MDALPLTGGFRRMLAYRYRTWQRTRSRRMVQVYRIMAAETTEIVYADEGDETLLGRHVGEMMRRGAQAVVVDRRRMTVAEADAIPSEQMVR